MDKNYQRANWILKIGLGLTILWFGVSQLLDPAQWIGYLPSWVFGIDFVTPITLVYLNGIFETVFGLLLIFSQFPRIVSIILAVHMGLIIGHLGYNDLAVRDFGLLAGFVALAFMNKDNSILNKFIKKDKKSKK